MIIILLLISLSPPPAMKLSVRSVINTKSRGTRWTLPKNGVDKSVIISRFRDNPIHESLPCPPAKWLAKRKAGSNDGNNTTRVSNNYTGAAGPGNRGEPTGGRLHLNRSPRTHKSAHRIASPPNKNHTVFGVWLLHKPCVVD